MLQFNQIPPMDEVWRIGDTWYVVRYAFQSRIPLIWAVSADDVQALGITSATRTFATWAEASKTGALFHGSSRELLNTKEDPVEAILSNYEREVRVKPWLADPEILAYWTAAALEGRSITESELQNTQWWRTHTQAERQWLSLNAADPATANRLIADNRMRVADLFSQAGVNNASQDLIDTVADFWTMGKWSEAYAVNQIRLLADPKLVGDLDPELASFRDGGLDTTRAGEADVRKMIETWLGPGSAGNWAEDHIKTWASRFREDPDARLEFEELLKRHRLALFPEYDNASLSYEDIAAPWRGVWSSVLGGAPDETDPLFTKIVRTNDLATAQSLLRKEGLKRGNRTVIDSFLSDINQAFGGTVRRSEPV